MAGGIEASTRLRVDTPIAAVLEGEPDCITSGRYGVDGRSYSLDLRGYKSNCVAGTPGETRTVWYHSGDPGVAAPNRRWYLWVLAAFPCAALALVGLRAGTRAPRGAEAPSVRARPRPHRRVTMRRSRPRTRPDAGVARGQLYDEGVDAPYIWDYALGWLGVLIDTIKNEDPGKLAVDPASVRAVLAHLEQGHRALVDSDLPGMEHHLANAARAGWRTPGTSPRWRSGWSPSGGTCWGVDCTGSELRLTSEPRFFHSSGLTTPHPPRPLRSDRHGRGARSLHARSGYAGQRESAVSGPYGSARRRGAWEGHGRPVCLRGGPVRT